MSQIDSYVRAAQKGVAWLVEQQNADGSVGPPEHLATFCYKSPYALAVTGHAVEANRLVSWMKANMLDEDGELGAAAGEGFPTYRVSWITQGAYRLARFDVSAPFVRWLAARQAPCGALRPHPDSDYVDTICTWGAMALVYAGRLDAAGRAADSVLSMIDQQPDDAKFYHTMTPDGTLRTSGDGAAFLDITQPGQGYYHLGIPMLLLVRLYLATGDTGHLATAMKLYELSERCAADAYAHTSAAKSMVAAAILYAITGQERMRARAVEQADFLLSIQDARGWWTLAGNDEVGIKIDATAEFAIFLTEAAATLGAAGGPA